MQQKRNVSKAKKGLYAKQTFHGVCSNFCVGTKKFNCQFVVLLLERQFYQSVGALIKHLSLLPTFFLNEIQFPPFFQKSILLLKLILRMRWFNMVTSMWFSTSLSVRFGFVSHWHSTVNVIIYISIFCVSILSRCVKHNYIDFVEPCPQQNKKEIRINLWRTLIASIVIVQNTFSPKMFIISSMKRSLSKHQFWNK